MRHPTPSPARLAEQFGRYRIVRKLGEGGMGAVYLAEDTQFRRQVALKVPTLDDRNDSEVLDRFRREARLAQTVHHPSICPVYEAGQIDGVHYLTMPFVEGTPLSDLVSPEQPWEQRRAAELVRRLALALQALHERQVIHRDLKPHNIMVRPGGEPVLMDFGLARSLDPREQCLTSMGQRLGTPAYMSPEQISGNREAVGPATDVYTLGVILYQLLTGRRPFNAPALSQLLHQVCMVAPPAPSTLRPGLDAGLEKICLKALAKGPQDRHAGMGELAADLEAWLRLAAYLADLEAYLRQEMGTPLLGRQPDSSGPGAVIPQAKELRGACPHCGRKLKLPADAWDKRVRCPGCRGRFHVPNDVPTLPQASPSVASQSEQGGHLTPLLAGNGESRPAGVRGAGEPEQRGGDGQHPLTAGPGPHDQGRA